MNGDTKAKEEEISLKYFSASKVMQIEWDGATYLIGKPENLVFKVAKKIPDNFDEMVIYHVNFNDFSCDCKGFEITKSRKGEPCKHLQLILVHIPESKYLISDEVKKTLSDEFLVELFPELKEKLMEHVKKQEGEKPGAIAVRDTFLDRWDEEKIIGLLSKDVVERTLDKYVYEYPLETKNGIKIIRGLGVHAIQDITHWMGGVELVDAAIIENNDSFSARVKVRDTVKGFDGFGFATESRYYKSGRERKHADFIAYRKGLRRALDQIIPVPVKERIFQMYEQARIEREKKVRVNEASNGI